MKYVLSICLVAISLMLASCGGKSNKPSTTIEVTLIDFQFQPNSFTVPAGKEITFKATNNGAVVHSFVIMKYGTSAGTEFTDEDKPNVYWETEVQPGADINTTFTAPDQPGEYEVVCHIPGHIQAGMVGKLIVTAGD